jgi:hypothetical protein
LHGAKGIEHLQAKKNNNNKRTIVRRQASFLRTPQTKRNVQIQSSTLFH